MIFMGCYIPKKEIEHVTKIMRKIPSNAPNLFQWNLIEGLNANHVKDFNIINGLSVGSWPKAHRKIYLPGQKVALKNGSYTEIATVNLPILKQLGRYILAVRYLKSCADKDVLIYSAYLPFLAAATKTRLSKNTTLIVTDLPEFYDLGDHQSCFYKFARSLISRLTNHFIKKVDKFVLLTEEMHVALKVEDRPFIVMEGIASSAENDESIDDANSLIDPNSKTIIMYSGSLTIQFGILDLLRVLEEVKSSELELWVCGIGEGEEIVKQLAEKDKRLKYYGFVKVSEVFRLQKMATLLVNPRRPVGEYTKYSFPSKTMEYMLSGTPVVMYKLPGLPDEYDEFLYLVKENETLSECLLRVMNLNNNERKTTGLRARSFILNKKNSTKQAARILSLQKGEM